MTDESMERGGSINVPILQPDSGLPVMAEHEDSSPTSINPAGLSSAIIKPAGLSSAPINPVILPLTRFNPAVLSSRDDVPLRQGGDTDEHIVQPESGLSASAEHRDLSLTSTNQAARLSPDEEELVSTISSGKKGDGDLYHRHIVFDEAESVVGLGPYSMDSETLRLTDFRSMVRSSGKDELLSDWIDRVGKLPPQEQIDECRTLMVSHAAEIETGYLKSAAVLAALIQIPGFRQLFQDKPVDAMTYQEPGLNILVHSAVKGVRVLRKKLASINSIKKAVESSPEAEVWHHLLDDSKSPCRANLLSRDALSRLSTFMTANPKVKPVELVCRMNAVMLERALSLRHPDHMPAGSRQSKIVGLRWTSRDVGEMQKKFVPGEIYPSISPSDIDKLNEHLHNQEVRIHPVFGALCQVDLCKEVEPASKPLIDVGQAPVPREPDEQGSRSAPVTDRNDDTTGCDVSSNGRDRDQDRETSHLSDSSNHDELQSNTRRGHGETARDRQRSATWARSTAPHRRRTTNKAAQSTQRRSAANSVGPAGQRKPKQLTKTPQDNDDQDESSVANSEDEEENTASEEGQTMNKTRGGTADPDTSDAEAEADDSDRSETSSDENSRDGTNIDKDKQGNTSSDEDEPDDDDGNVDKGRSQVRTGGTEARGDEKCAYCSDAKSDGSDPSLLNGLIKGKWGFDERVRKYHTGEDKDICLNHLYAIADAIYGAPVKRSPRVASQSLRAYSLAMIWVKERIDTGFQHPNTGKRKRSIEASDDTQSSELCKKARV